MLAPLTSSARFLVLGALLASPLTTLAAPKPAASNSALVAALQAVSPDPLAVVSAWSPRPPASARSGPSGRRAPN